MMDLKHGKISITRPYGGGRPDGEIEIQITDKTSGRKFFTVLVSAENLTLALTGAAARPCEFELKNLDLIGKVRENKVVSVLMDKDCDRWGEAGRAEIAKRLALHEVDGWVANMETATNHNNATERQDDGSYLQRVTFYRYVDTPAPEPEKARSDHFERRKPNDAWGWEGPPDA